MKERYPKAMIPCTIGRGGFGNERTYRVELPDGEEHIGIAPWIYCYNKKKDQIEKEPAPGERIKGFVAARQIVKGEDTTRVEFPDGQIAIILTKMVKPFEESPNCVSL